MVLVDLGLVCCGLGLIMALVCISLGNDLVGFGLGRFRLWCFFGISY